jgi:hypothetical protein
LTVVEADSRLVEREGTTMRERMRFAALAVAVTGLGLTGVAGPAAVAAPPVSGQLNPEPPASYVCSAIGAGTRCVSDTTEVLDPEPTGIVCGSGSGSFEVMDRATRRVVAERWYDTDGNLVKRVRSNLFSDSALFHPGTGASVPYSQHDTDTDVLATPGDLESRTTYSVESFVATARGAGAVVVNKGRSVYTADGSVLERTGRRDFDAYASGDVTVMDGLCRSLAG